jgi:hypothetical protein
MFRLHPSHKVRPPRSLTRKRVALSVEGLEERVVPYALTGNAWPHANYVTLSFVPDGTVVGSVGGNPAYSNLFATLNARFGSASVWEPQILRAAQNWAAMTNLNLQVVSDNGTSIGQGAYEQGDPNMGDIRISGYNFGGNTDLADTYFPPQGNNFSIAGDVQFNTAYTWNIGSNYDLYTVAMHELGHAFGLADITTDPNASEYTYYDGIHGGLDSDDVAGIRAVYSGGQPRSPDGIQGDNGTPQTATDLTGLINGSTKTFAMAGFSLSSPQPEWFKITAPQGTVSNPTVLVQSLYQSLLAPAVYVYSSYGVLLASANAGLPYNGTILTANPGGVTAGQVLYIEVTSTTTTSFDIGTYALSLNFGTGATPTFAAPNTTTANGNPLQSVGYQSQDPPLAFAKPSLSVADQVALLQITQVAPATAAPVNPVLLVGQSAIQVSTFNVFVPAQPAHTSTLARPPLLLRPDDTGPAADDLAPEYSPVPVAMSAPAPVAAEPQQMTRALPATNEDWAQETTAFFEAEAPQAEEAAVPAQASAPRFAVEAAVALAGLVSIAGEQRRAGKRAYKESNKHSNF